MAKRFASDINIPEILSAKFSKKTRYMNKYGERLLETYIREKNIPVNFSSSDSLDSLLTNFYACVRKEDGTPFTVSTFISLRYSLARVIKEKYHFDIINDILFTKSNEVFSALIIDLKKTGNAIIKHFPIISDDDLKLIAEMPTNTPSSLQLKVWFTIHLHFVLRGRENLHDMIKSDLIFYTEDGIEKIQMRDKLTKNHRSDTKPSVDGVISAINNSDCPVKLIKSYLGKLRHDVDALWQKPRSTVEETTKIWYCAQKIGINTVVNFMKRLSELIPLSQMYTNHSVRATAITLLGRTFQDTDVACFSGHKSLNALGIYKRVSPEKKKNMSDCLSNALKNSTIATECCEKDEDKDLTHQTHHNCCISYGAFEELNNIPPSLSIEGGHFLTPAENDECDKEMPILVPMDMSTIPVSSFCKITTSSTENIVDQCVKKGNKVYIFNNCSGNFNF
jgi:hypothetical protein